MISIDLTSIFTWAESNNFIVVVFAFCVVAILLGFIFKTFLHAAILTVAIILALSFTIRYLPDDLKEKIGVENVETVQEIGNGIVDGVEQGLGIEDE